MVKMSAIDELERLEARAQAFVRQNKKLSACKVFIKAQYSTAYALAQVNRMFAALPAGEAVETTNVLEIPMGLTPEEEAWFRREMSAPIIDTTNTANTVASLQADLDAALARAEKAEGEAARLRMVLSLTPIHDEVLAFHEAYQNFDGQCPHCRCDSDEPHKEACPVSSLSSYVDSLK